MKNKGIFSKKLAIFSLVAALLLLLLIPSSTAFSFDNRVNQEVTTFDGKSIIGNKLLEKYKPIKIENTFGLGKTLFEGYLSEHTESCGNDCQSIIPIRQSDDGVLIEDIRFKVLQPDGSWVEKSIKNYQLYVNNKPYQIGQEVKAGDLEIKLTGEKKLSRVVDWQIKVQGKWLESWAVWGDGNLIDDILSNYNFDEQSDDSTGFVDLTDTSYVASGIINQALDLTNTHELWGQHLQGSNNFTINLWVKPDVGANWGTSNYRILELGGSGDTLANGEFTWKTTSGNFFRLNQGGQIDVTVGDPTEDVWSMLTIVMDSGTNVSSYMNGSIVDSDASFSGFSVRTTLPLVLFAANTTNIYALQNGAIDELSIWNRSLSISEIEILYNSHESFAYPFGGASLNSPVDSYSSNTSTVTFNCSASVGSSTIKNISLVTNQSGTFEIVNTTGGLSGTFASAEWNHNINGDGSYLWSCQSCAIDDDCVLSTENRTVIIDSLPPIITINQPTSTINYGYINKNETLNWSIVEPNLDSVWYNYNGTNVTIYGSENTTTFNIESYENNNLTIYANDTNGKENSTFVSWDYKLFANAESYSTSTSEGSTETFQFNSTVLSGRQFSTINLVYNNTNYPATISNPAGNNYTLTRILEIPSVSATLNNTFYWNILLDDDTEINTTSHLQEVIGISIDNCSTNTNLLYNFTVVDELTQNRFSPTTYNTSGNLNLQLYTLDRSVVVENFTLKQNNSDEYLVCLSSNLSGNVEYSVDVELQYDADSYAAEFYHIQNATITSSSLNTNITLYDLIDSKSQEFVVTYKDSSFLGVEGAIIQIQRKYVGEGLFKTIEIPKTDIDGEAVAHLELADAIYTFIVVKNGKILGTFSNVHAICQDIVLGNCDIKLNEVISGTSTSDFTELDDLSLSLTYNQTSRVLASVFSVPSGTPKALKLNATLYDALGDTEVCSDYLTSSSGTLSCDVPSSFGNATMIVTVVADDSEVAKTWVKMSQINKDLYGTSIVFLSLFLFLTLIGIGVSDNPMVTGFFILIGILLSVGLNLINTPSFIGTGSTILWIIVVIVLIFIKGAKR